MSSESIGTLLQRAIAHHKTGDLPEAERSYRAVLQLEPHHAEANHNLGLIALALGRLEVALALFQAALQAKPEQGQFWVSCIDLMARLGRLDEARSLLAEGQRRGLQGAAIQALAQQLASGAAAPASPRQADMLAVVNLFQAGRHAEAEPKARALTVQFPEHGFAWAILGALLRAQQRNAEALPPLQTAAALSPRDAQLQFNLGNLLRDLGRSQEAASHYQQALQLAPDFAEAAYQLGNMQQDLGRTAESERSYRQALQVAPDHAMAHANLAHTLHDLGRLDDAHASYQRALELEPHNAALHFNLGDLLHDQGRLQEAEAACRLALRLDPALAPAHSHLGTILQDQGRLEEALACYRQALQLQPNDLGIRSSLLFCLNYMPKHNSATCLAEARQFGQIAARGAGGEFTRWACAAEPARLRVGLVSGDLREHPVGYFLENVLSHVDPQRVELVAFPTQACAGALTDRIRGYFADWKPLAGLDDAAAASLVHAEGLHVLLDLSGHTAHNRLPLFARKPAPVQATWLGYFATTGLAAMDYLIADPWSLPGSDETHFTEKIWRLPQTRLCFTVPRVALDVGPLPALGRGDITFGCFNNISKINDDVVALWCRVLAAVPGSRLLLKAKQFRDAAVRQAMRARFARHGLDAGRLILEGPSTREAYLAAYHQVDVGLDPFPFPGGTTTVESLWMGVPVLTLAGSRFLSRQGVGILMNAGLADWIAADADDYVARVVQHTRDLPRLAELRQGLRPQVVASPVFDAPRFARHLEDALHAMWQQRTRAR